MQVAIVSEYNDAFDPALFPILSQEPIVLLHLLQGDLYCLATVVSEYFRVHAKAGCSV